MAGVLQELLTPYVAATFPKQITIHNIWVGLLFWGLRVLSLIWCAYGLWTIRAQTIKVVPLSAAAFWSTQSKRYAEAQQADLQSAHCSNPDQFQYQYDAEGIFRYTNLSCSNLQAERWFKGESELYFPSFVQENVTQVLAVVGLDCSKSCAINVSCASGEAVATGERNDMKQCLCKCTTSRNRFITAVEENIVSWEHAVIAEERTAWVQKVHTASSGTASDKLKTIFRYENGTTMKSFAPGEIITISLGELFAMSHTKISLNQYLDDTIINFIKGDGISAYPLLRMTGFRLEVIQNYYNEEDPSHPHDHDGPVCIVTVQGVKEWSSQPRIDFSDPSDLATGTGKFRHRYYYGVRVTFRATGSFSFFDPERIFGIIATIVVYLSLPTSIAMFIVNNMLGTLSVIYSNATYEIIDVPSLLKGILTRALAAHQAYWAFWRGKTATEAGVESLRPELEQSTVTSLREPVSSEADSVEEAISRHKVEPHESVLLARLRALFKAVNVDGKLDEGELSTIQVLLTESMGVSTQMTERQFIEYHLSGDSADLATISDVFDVERRRYPLERLFDTDVPTKKSLQRTLSKRFPDRVHPEGSEYLS